MIAFYDENGAERCVIHTQLSPSELARLPRAISSILRDALNGELTNEGRQSAALLLKLQDDISLDESHVLERRHQEAR